SGTVLVSGFAGLALGRALDRFGARVLMSLGSVLSGLSLLAMARVHSLVAFDALWTLGLGLGTALTYYPVSFTVVANWFDRRRRQALALLTLLGALASPVAYPLVGWSIAAVGWRETLVRLAVVQLAIALPLHLVFVRRHPEDHGLRPDGGSEPSAWTPESGIDWRRAVGGAAFWTLTGALALAYFGSTFILLEHVAYLIARGYAPTLAAALVGMLGLVYLPGRWLIAVASARIGTIALLAVAFLLEAAGVALLLVAHDVVWVVGYVVVFGVAYGATAPLRAAIVAERFGRRAYGTIFAAQNAIVGVAAALGPIVAGRLVDVAGYGSAFGACIAAFIVAALVVVFPVSVAKS
ncbi:MAG: MFS transporter, partial [Polyangiales bacterium]